MKAVAKAVANDKILTMRIRTFQIPTETHEADGTLDWDHTTLVLVELSARGKVGLGYTYADRATAQVIHDVLRPSVVGSDPMDIPATRAAMARSVRNLGRAGICAMAISAVDNALWDLKARVLGLPLARLLGQVRASVPIYGSGGFTSYSDQQLEAHMAHWMELGLKRVKIKIGSEPDKDPERVRLVRGVIGPEAELLVDANGAYTVKQALQLAEAFEVYEVTWFEEPVSSDDLSGLRQVCEGAPPTMEVAAGEYGYHSDYFRRMLQSGAVDVLQADATRCQGISGFLEAAVMADAWHKPLSAHCAPSQHVHAGCSCLRLRHLEYFFDHVRIERMLFDGFVEPKDGELAPDLTREGIGLELKERDALRFSA